MPYTDTETTILNSLIKKHGEKIGRDMFNKMRARGDLGEDSKRRMMDRAARARRGEVVDE